ncbi:MAG: type VI secretion system protein TssL, long form [Pseudomonadota bacterium]
MSDSNNPGGRRPRTIVVPNPGGRRPADGGDPFGTPPAYPGNAPPPPYPGTPPGGASPYGNPWDTTPAPQSVPQPVPQQPAYAPPPQQPAYAPQPEAGAPSEPPMAAAALLHSRAALNENAMMRAAQPLLLMLARMRAGMVQASSAAIMDDVAATIHNFDNEVRGAGYNDDQVQVAKYALCATADDVIQNIPVDDRQRWTQYSMLSRFFSERIGGILFFEELNRMRADPIVNVAVLELMYACMAAGFEGVYRTSPNGVATLQQVQRDIYDTIRRVRPRESAELSPRWQGLTIATNARRNRVPLWAVASMVLALVLGTFVVLRTLLAFDSTTASDDMLALIPTTPVTIVRAEFTPKVAEPPPEKATFEPPPPPPPPPEVETVSDKLSADIKSGAVIVDEAGEDIRITIGDIVGMVLFKSASTTITEQYLPVVERIGQTLNDQPGEITVIGHTDAVPIRSVRFPSNYELSVARAEEVARVLSEELTDPSRVKAIGRGADSPIDNNNTPEGRARNRRVDIIVPRSTPQS